jgi:hypothetical protein
VSRAGELAASIERCGYFYRPNRRLGAILHPDLTKDGLEVNLPGLPGRLCHVHQRSPCSSFPRLGSQGRRPRGSIAWVSIHNHRQSWALVARGACRAGDTLFVKRRRTIIPREAPTSAAGRGERSWTSCTPVDREWCRRLNAPRSITSSARWVRSLIRVFRQHLERAPT